MNAHKKLDITCLSNQIFMEKCIYSTETYFSYKAIVNRNFKGYNLKNSKVNDLLQEYTRLNSLKKDKLAKIFYIHALSSNEINVQTKLGLVKEVDQLEIFHKDEKDAQNKLERLITGIKHYAIKDYITKLHSKNKEDKKPEQILQISLSQERLEMRIKSQIFTNFLRKKIELDKQNSSEFEQLCYSVGL